MGRLGYQRYGVQGGDWGAIISRELGRTRPEVIGVHLNLLPGAAATEEPSAGTATAPAMPRSSPPGRKRSPTR
jgi:hypothetical protein